MSNAETADGGRLRRFLLHRLAPVSISLMILFVAKVVLAPDNNSGSGATPPSIKLNSISYNPLPQVTTTRAAHQAAGFVGYNDPELLAQSLTKKVDQRLSNPKGRCYQKGVKVRRSVCLLDHGHTFECVVQYNNGMASSPELIVSADGLTWISK